MALCVRCTRHPYEAPSPGAIRAVGRRADAPDDEIVEVGPGTPQSSDGLRARADAVG